MTGFSRFIFLAGIIIILTSCKERNDQFPPTDWVNYFYEKDAVKARPISAILEVDDHTEWFGSLGSEGLVYNNGYGYSVIDNTNCPLSFDSVTSIAKDGNGIIWVAWKAGLALYDGTTWKSVLQFNGKRVTSIAIQGIGTVWVGIDGDGQSGGLAKWSNGSWQSINQSNSDIPSSRVTSLAFDLNQQLWIGTSDKGLIRYNGLSWKEFSPEDPGNTCRVNAITIDENDNVWAGTSSSKLIKVKGEEMWTLSTGVAAPVTRLIVDHQGKIWIGTSGDGILTLQAGEWTRLNSLTDFLPGDSILSMALHPDGHVLASFNDGHILYFK